MVRPVCPCGEPVPVEVMNAAVGAVVVPGVKYVVECPRGHEMSIGGEALVYMLETPTADIYCPEWATPLDE